MHGCEESRKHASKKTIKDCLNFLPLFMCGYELLHICIEAIAINGLIFVHTHGFPLMSEVVFMIYKELFLMLKLS